MTSLFPIEQKICEQLDQTASGVYSLYSKESKPGLTEWTNEVKATLYRLACKYDVQPWGIGAKEAVGGCSEWLVDVCWIKVGRDKDDGEYDWQRFFYGLLFACEIEWKYSDRELLNDFLKLTVVRADYRLFVFACHKAEEANGIFERLIRHCPQANGARYLAIAVPDRTHKKVPLPRRAWTL